MEVKRRNFQGVLNILSFNRHFYIIGILVWIVILVVLSLFKLSPVWFWIISIAFIYGLLMPLIVSAYAYDFSGYYHFNWLKQLNLIETKPQQIVNINAGFDETSFILEGKFPNSDLQVFDFYDKKRHTEPAIVRARKVSLVYPNTQEINSYKIPLESESTDIVFLLSSVHEIRQEKERIAFLKECKRICKPSGKIITVEHLRDLPNFLAFSIGFTHFFSRKTWKKAFDEAGFISFKERKFTPFMSIFECSKK
ncbi:MAG: methyltransferase type 11 [Mesonia sp.]|nr:methyltransferase type 11 [Mesonia sp.]MAQ40467.1 methyltransferase type 11 [Mesonia sp.]MBJ98088.1 methyltransferase type 11 [Flavobacteriaceae bacterium]|tara:strand:+ start:20286 stop:21041 length:756 start_codon:yes stop_codon:yes gene_type:complete